MITLLSGTPGSGKSIHMAKKIYWDIKMKRPVIANFEINESLFDDASTFYYVPDEHLKPDKLVEFSKWWFQDEGHEFGEGKIKLYWDESQIRLNTRDWRYNSEWIRFFTQHRKLGYDVYLVAQHHEMLDKQVRNVIEYEIMHRKANNVGLFGWLVNAVMLGRPLVCCVRRWYGMRMRLDCEWIVGTKRDYRLFDSYKVFDKV